MAFFHMTAGMDKHQHESVEQARNCEDELLHEEWQVLQEIAAEQAIERFYETDFRLADETARELAEEGVWV